MTRPDVPPATGVVPTLIVFGPDAPVAPVGPAGPGAPLRFTFQAE